MQLSVPRRHPVHVTDRMGGVWCTGARVGGVWCTGARVGGAGASPRARASATPISASVSPFFSRKAICDTWYACCMWAAYLLGHSRSLHARVVEKLHCRAHLRREPHQTTAKRTMSSLGTSPLLLGALLCEILTFRCADGADGRAQRDDGLSPRPRMPAEHDLRGTSKNMRAIYQLYGVVPVSAAAVAHRLAHWKNFSSPP